MPAAWHLPKIKIESHIPGFLFHSRIIILYTPLPINTTLTIGKVHVGTAHVPPFFMCTSRGKMPLWGTWSTKPLCTTILSKGIFQNTCPKRRKNKRKKVSSVARHWHECEPFSLMMNTLFVMQHKVLCPMVGGLKCSTCLPNSLVVGRTNVFFK